MSETSFRRFSAGLLFALLLGLFGVLYSAVTDVAVLRADIREQNVRIAQLKEETAEARRNYREIRNLLITIAGKLARIEERLGYAPEQEQRDPYARRGGR